MVALSALPCPGNRTEQPQTSSRGGLGGEETGFE